MGKAVQSSRTGDLLNGEYELHEAIASGPDFDTYRATDHKHDRAVQVRLLKPELALDAAALQRFHAPPRALSGLRHPNVAQILALGSDETGIPFIVQEDVQGEPLTATVASFAQGMPLGVAITVLSPVIDAVAAAHEIGLVHGRLTHERVLLVRAGGNTVPKVTGFGDAPEGADASSDVWALGALLYQALCGASAGRPGKPHTPLDEQAPHLPAELTTLVERCLSRDPSARPRDASAIRDALQSTAARARGGARKTDAGAKREPATAGKPASKPAAKPPARAPRAAREGEVDTQPVPAQEQERARKASAAAAPAATVPGERAGLGFHATVAMQPAPSVAKASEAPEGFDLAFEEASDGDDEPELSFEAAASDPPGALGATRSARPAASARPAVIKTAGDLAAAFAPMEGEEHIEQGESDKAVLVRSFKQSFEEAQAAAGKARKVARFGAEAKREQAQAKQDEDRPSAVGAPLKSRKDLREGGGPKPVALVLTEQHLAGIRKAAEGERKDDSLIGMLLFLLFVFLLPFATSLLRDPEQAKTVLRGNEQVVAGLFTVLTVVALVRTWALQIKSAPTLLRPVNTTLKIVTAAVCILGASFFFPGKQLGPPYRAAHMALPWLASGFYAFLALYGIARALREAGQGILRSVGMTVLYLGAFFGSYQVLASTVLSKQEQASQRGKRTGIAAITGNLLHGGKGEAAAEALLDAGVAADKPMQQRGEVGASEADDMAAIEELSRGKQEKGKQLNKLSEQMKDMTK